jgi:hypothetical protein
MGVIAGACSESPNDDSGGSHAGGEGGEAGDGALGGRAGKAGQAGRASGGSSGSGVVGHSGRGGTASGGKGALGGGAGQAGEAGSGGDTGGLVGGKGGSKSTGGTGDDGGIGGDPAGGAPTSGTGAGGRGGRGISGAGGGGRGGRSTGGTGGSTGGTGGSTGGTGGSSGGTGGSTGGTGPAPYCGDGSCNGSENMSSCCTDCGCGDGYTCSGNACMCSEASFTVTSSLHDVGNYCFSGSSYYPYTQYAASYINDGSGWVYLPEGGWVTYSDPVGTTIGGSFQCCLLDGCYGDLSCPTPYGNYPCLCNPAQSWSKYLSMCVDSGTICN